MNDKNISDRVVAANLLADVLSGSLTPADARTRWPIVEGDKLLDSAYHALYHFEDDADIRATDEKYEQWQRQSLLEFIRELNDQKMQ
jgi:hypothetical protein